MMMSGFKRLKCFSPGLILKLSLILDGRLSLLRFQRVTHVIFFPLIILVHCQTTVHLN